MIILHRCFLALLTFASFIISQPIQKLYAEQPKDLSTAGLAQIAFSVGKRAVTWRDIRDRYLFIIKTSNMSDTQKVRDTFLPQVIQQLCNEQVQLELVSKAGLKYSKDDQQNSLTYFAEMNGMTLDQLKKSFEVQGLSLSTLNQRLKAQNLWVQYIRGAEGSIVKITPIKIEKRRQEYEKARKLTQYELREIIVQDATVAQEVYARAIEGKTPFSVLAQEFSVSISSKNGGVIGWVNTQQMNQNIQESFKSVLSQNDSYKAIGKISKPLKSAQGFSIYQISDVRSPNKPAYGQTEVKIIKREISIPDFTNEEGVATFEEAMTDMMKVRGEKAFRNHDCAYADALVSEQKAKLTSLSDHMRHLVENLPLNTPSKPIQVDKNKMVMFMVISRHVLPEKKVSDDDIAMDLRQTMLERFATAHLRQYRMLIPISDATGVIKNATPMVNTVAKKIS